MYFEVYKKGNLIVRGKNTLNNISFENELMLAPTTTLVLPVDWLKIIDGREEIKIFLDESRVFWGIVWDIEVNKENETIELDIRHVVTEWQYRQISVNHAMSNEKLNIVYKGNKTEKTEAETITANDFAVKADDIDGYSLADWVSKASAAAWSNLNGDKVAITSVNRDSIVKTQEEDEPWPMYHNGTYPVSFSTASGTTLTVDCEVNTLVDITSRDSVTDEDKNETISAVPFSVSVDKKMSVEEAKALADPKACKADDETKPIPVAAVITDFNGSVVGRYTLSAATANGTSVTVELEVVEAEGPEYITLPDPAVVDKISDIYMDKNFAYPGWQIEFRDGSQNQMIDYVYSRQNKLDALTQTMELTDDLWWRVGLWNEKRLQIGKFGDKKPYILSKKPSGKTNIRIIGEPTIDYDFENVINVATVYSDKTDGGMSSLTLREVYMNPSLQKSGFPVVILHSNVNNERDYTKYISQFPKLAPNNEIEYAVIDEESIALEQGTVIEGTYAFNDLSPFEIDGKVISDDKRIKAAVTAYNGVIKRLIQARRSYDVHIVTEPIPCDLEVGDRVRFIYDNDLWKMDACSSYWKKILSYSDYFYVTSITYNYDEYGNLTNELTLTKWLKTERETSNT